MESSARVLITGATGFIGAHLADHFTRPIVLSRDPERAAAKLGDVEAHGWDTNIAIPPKLMDGVDTVFHLAGDPVADGKWTEEKRARVRESRVNGTRRVVEAIRAASNGPRVLVCASAVGFYGSRGDEVLTEESTPGKDFLSDVCSEWEAEALAVRDSGVRVVTVRIGLVLGESGGALGKMLPIFRLGLGGPLGSGKQWMPWIHVDDVVGIMLHGATNDVINGALNATAPEPATNHEFTRALAAALHRPAFFRAPEFALKLALGDFADVILASQRVLPKVALRTEYRFRHRTIDEAMRAAIGSRP